MDAVQTRKTVSQKWIWQIGCSVCCSGSGWQQVERIGQLSPWVHWPKESQQFKAFSQPSAKRPGVSSHGCASSGNCGQRRSFGNLCTSTTVQRECRTHLVNGIKHTGGADGEAVAGDADDVALHGCTSTRFPKSSVTAVPSLVNAPWPQICQKRRSDSLRHQLNAPLKPRSSLTKPRRLIDTALMTCTRGSAA